MRVLFALPGLHRVVRGAETAFEQLAKHMAELPNYEVTLIGSGQPQADKPYRFLHAPCISREHFERFPSIPYILRSHFVYEELTFMPGLFAAYDPAEYDVTVTCSYPYTNWLLRAKRSSNNPRHVFVTQNGDWMCHGKTSEFKYFGCDGLVCTNPEYYEQNCNNYFTTLIPNGVDPALFTPGTGDRASFGLPEHAPVVLMVSALSPSKRVIEGIRSVAKLPNVHLAIAGDGELRHQVEAMGRSLLGDRLHLLKLPRERMPELYRCADVFLHMSQDEPSSNAYIEALATGLPIVTHDRRVTRWTLEDCGNYVNTSDEEAVSQSISKAFSEKTALAIRQRRELVERRFTWSRLAEQYATFFEQVCQRIPSQIFTPSLQRIEVGEMSVANLDNQIFTPSLQCIEVGEMHATKLDLV